MLEGPKPSFPEDPWNYLVSLKIQVEDKDDFISPIQA